MLVLSQCIEIFRAGALVTAVASELLLAGCRMTARDCLLWKQSPSTIAWRTTCCALSSPPGITVQHHVGACSAHCAGRSSPSVGCTTLSLACTAATGVRSPALTQGWSLSNLVRGA